MRRHDSTSHSARFGTILALVLCGSAAGAQPASEPPCGIEPSSSYPDAGAPPVVRFWRPGDVPKNLNLAECTGWPAPGFSTLVTIAARFHYTGGADSLLWRIGATSTLAGTRYWSTSHKKWQTLIVAASAVGDAKGKERRTDFTPTDLRFGDAVYFEQTDNLAGKAVYRMRVTEASPDRIVFSVENVSAMRYVVITLFHPGDMQSIYFLDRESADVWRFYLITRTGERASGMVTGKPASSINRAVAFFRHYAGIATDRDPPAAR
jgi:hypothetical protein